MAIRIPSRTTWNSSLQKTDHKSSITPLIQNLKRVEIRGVFGEYSLARSWKMIRYMAVKIRSEVQKGMLSSQTDYLEFNAENYEV